MRHTAVLVQRLPWLQLDLETYVTEHCIYWGAQNITNAYIGTAVGTSPPLHFLPYSRATVSDAAMLFRRYFV